MSGPFQNDEPKARKTQTDFVPGRTLQNGATSSTGGHNRCSHRRLRCAKREVPILPARRVHQASYGSKEAAHCSYRQVTTFCPRTKSAGPNVLSSRCGISNHASGCAHSTVREPVLKTALRFAPCCKGTRILCEPLFQQLQPAPTLRACRSRTPFCA